MFNSLTPVQVSSRQRSYDIKYSFSTDKFIVNPTFRKNAGLTNSGLNLFIDQTNSPVLVVTPYEHAKLYKKSPFSCKELKELLSIEEEDVYFKAVEGTVEGYKVFYLEELKRKQPKTQVEQEPVTFI